MREYQKFAISNYRVGFDEALEPWLLPRDGYQQIINAHLYRGVLQSIPGYDLFARFTNRMEIDKGGGNGLTKTFSGTLNPLPVNSNIIVYGTITIGTAEIGSYSSDTVVAGDATILLTGSAGGSGSVDLITGAWTFTFNTAPPGGAGSDVIISYDFAPAMATAIMGIKPYYPSTGGQQVIVFDQLRAGLLITNQSSYLETAAGCPLTVSEIPHDYYNSAVFTGDGVTTTFHTSGGGANATLLAGFPFVPGSIQFTEYTSAGAPTGNVITDLDNSLVGPHVSSGFVDYLNGKYSITFSVAPPSGNYYDATGGIYGNLFSGNIYNFFSYTTYLYLAFFSNNVNPPFYYDGRSIHYLPTNLSVTPTTNTLGVPTSYDITQCLHVFINRGYLLLINVTLKGALKLQQSSIYWSQVQNPLIFSDNSFLPAPTSEAIVAIGFINTDLVIRFNNSEMVFRFTEDVFSPFRFDPTNNQWACDSSYGTINYDKWFSTVGRPAIVGSDAVNVKRVDEIIPDFTDPERLTQQVPVPWLNQSSIAICYGQRFDDIKEGWLCYNSQPITQSNITASDNILAFNYLDETYAIYQFPFSCLGLGVIPSGQTWSTTQSTWAATNDTWNDYQFTQNALVDLAGDQFDKVYQLNVGSSLGDNTTPVLMSVISKNFNPFIEDGELCRFGYLDLFVSSNQQTTLRVQFYINDELYIDGSGNPAGYWQESIIQFAPADAMSSANQTKVWKRIYVGAVAKSHTIRFYQNSADFTTSTLDQFVWIHAMVLHMKPAGRIFN